MKLKHRTVTALISAFVTVTAFVLTCFVGCAASRSAEGIVLNTVRAAETSAAANEASPQAENSYILTATVKPDNASNKNVVWSCYWNGTTSKNINDYFKLTPNGNSATVTCLARFDTQIVVKAASEENGSIFATTLVDYYRKAQSGTSTIVCKIDGNGNVSGEIPLDKCFTPGTLCADWQPYISGTASDIASDDVSYFNFYPRSGAPGLRDYMQSWCEKNYKWWLPSYQIHWCDYSNPGDRSTLYNFVYHPYYENARKHFSIEFDTEKSVISLSFDWEWFNHWGTDMYWYNEDDEESNTDFEWQEYIRDYGGIVTLQLYVDYVTASGSTERILWTLSIEIDNSEI